MSKVINIIPLSKSNIIRSLSINLIFASISLVTFKGLYKTTSSHYNLEKKMHSPSRKTSEHINLKILALTFHLIFLISTVHSQSTQRLAEHNNITELIVATLNQTILNVNVSYTTFYNLHKRLGPNIAHRYRCAFEDCLGLLDDTIFDLETAISKLQTSSLGAHDVNMLLSDAMTNQDTCLEGFTTSGIHENNYDNTYILTDSLKDSILEISSNLSNSLGMLQKIPGHEHSPEALEVDVEFPSWVLENDKRRLHAPVEKTQFNIMVARDGTGNFTTINAAVSAAPNSSVTRYTYIWPPRSKAPTLTLIWNKIIKCKSILVLFYLLFSSNTSSEIGDVGTKKIYVHVCFGLSMLIIYVSQKKCW